MIMRVSSRAYDAEFWPDNYSSKRMAVKNDTLVLVLNSPEGYYQQSVFYRVKQRIQCFYNNMIDTIHCDNLYFLENRTKVSS